MWVSEQSVETRAQPESIWPILADISAWPKWNVDIEYVEANGPLVAGTTVTLGERGVGPVKSQIVEVVTGRSLSLGIDLDGGTLSVTYRIRVWAGSTRIDHRMVVEGPNDQVIGQQMASVVAQRIPHILQELVRLAELA